MRHGHLKRLEHNATSGKAYGRTSFSRTIADKCSSSCNPTARVESLSWAQQKRKNKYHKRVLGASLPDWIRVEMCMGGGQHMDAEAAFRSSSFSAFDGWDADQNWYQDQQQQETTSPKECQENSSEAALAPDVLGSAKNQAKLWHQAEATAAATAKAYMRSLPAVDQASYAKTAAVVLPQAPAMATPAKPFLCPPPGAGGPPDPEGHKLLAAMAAEVVDKQSKPSRLSNTRAVNKGMLATVDAFSEEYMLVVDYFQKTMCRKDATVQALHRVENGDVCKKFRRRSDDDDTMMFHGCRSRANEDSIIRDGFKVSSCLSGGKGFGTWFAYGAAYSDSGYAFWDAQGMKHLFVCKVSYCHTVLDNATMRVVGQDCAVPLWRLTYKLKPGPIAVKKKATPGPEAFFIAKDGCWVPEKTQNGMATAR